MKDLAELLGTSPLLKRGTTDALLREGLGEAARQLHQAPAERAGFHLLPLYPKQEAIVEDSARFTITEASPKSGKTMSHLEWFFWSGAQRGYGNSWWVAPVTSTAAIAYRRAQERLRGYLDSGRGPIKVAEAVPFEKHDSEKWIDAFGVRFWFKGSDKPDTLYGEDVYDAVGDEITRWKEDSWYALYTTLTATQGRAKLIGNVKGRRNFAYRLARKAEGGEAGWAHHLLTAYDAVAGGVVQADVIEQAKRDLPDAVFRELYLAQASDDQGNPFGLGSIRACIGRLSTLKPVAWGWDLAKSVDWTVGVGLDAEGRLCRFRRFQKPWRATISAIIGATAGAPALVDSTGVGDPVLEELQNGRHNFEGYKFTAPSKQQLMEGLSLAIQGADLTYPGDAPKNAAGEPLPLQSELEAFEYEYTRTGTRYSAPDGLHDDCVVALALARELLARQGRGRRRHGLVVPIGVNGNGKNGARKNGRSGLVTTASRAA